MTDFAARADHAAPLAHLLDRWIFVITAALFIAIVLTGFVPASLAKIAAVEAGERPPFPVEMHLHAALMGSFLLLLFVQSFLVATGRQAGHQRLGLVGMVLAPALVVVGLFLVPTIYQGVWEAIQAAPAEVQPLIRQGLHEFDNIMLLQIRVGILFPIFIGIALAARRRDPGMHKRMMFLAVALALPAAFDRMTWLPSTLPEGPLTTDLYPLVALAPMFIWDVVRTRKVHKAYLVWLAIVVPTSLVVHALWDTEWWHQTAPWIAGVSAG